MLYAKSLLIVCLIHTSVCLLIPSSRYPSPHISDLVTISLFSVCKSLSVFKTSSLVSFLKLDSTHEGYHAVFVLLTSFSMIIARSIDVAVNVIILVFFKWLNDIPLYTYIPYLL